MITLDHAKGVPEHGQGAQPQKVHLQEAGFFQVAHHPLGGDGRLARLSVLALSDHPLQRDKIDQGTVGNHHTRRMGSHIPVGPLQFEGDLQDAGDITAFVPSPSKIRAFFQGLFQGDTRTVRHKRGEKIDLFQGKIVDTTDILDRGLGGHCAKGPNLGDARFPVALPDIGDHLVPALLAEIDINIRRLRPIGIEEALKQQIIFQWTNVAELQHVADQCAASGSPCPARNALFLCETHEITNHQKIACETHPTNDGKLMLHPLAHRIRNGLAVTLGNPLLAQIAQVLFGRFAFGGQVHRKMSFFQIQVNVD